MYCTKSPNHEKQMHPFFGGTKAASFLRESNFPFHQDALTLFSVYGNRLSWKFCYYSLHLLCHRLEQGNIRSTSFTLLPKAKCGIKEVGIPALESYSTSRQ